MDPNNLGSLLSLLAKNYQQADSNNKTFSQMLADRRAFVENASHGVGNQIDQQLQNGSNGANLSPAQLKTPALQFGEGMTNKTTDLTNQMFGNQKAALDALLGGIGIAQQANQTSVAKQQNALEAAKYGLQYDPTSGTYGYGDSSSGGSSVSGPANPSVSTGSKVSGNPISQVTQQGGADLLAQAPDAPSKYALAAKIIQSGGVGEYRKNNSNAVSPQDADAINGTNITLNQINRIQDRLSTSPALKNILDNPALNALAKVAVNTGNMRMLQMFGLNSEDVQALGDLVSLNAQGDRALVGGRLSGYLSNRLSPAQPGLDKNANQNITNIKTLKKNILDGAKAYAKDKGYNYYTDIPNLNLGPVKMTAPDGSLGYIDQNEVGQAIKNGYKEAQ